MCIWTGKRQDEGDVIGYVALIPAHCARTVLFLEPMMRNHYIMARDHCQHAKTISTGKSHLDLLYL